MLSKKIISGSELIIPSALALENESIMKLSNELYDNYVSDIDIFQLGQFANTAGSSEDPSARDDITHGVKLYDCYPTSIGAPALAYEGGGIFEFTVTFKYRHWMNYFINKTQDVELGDGGFDMSIAQEPGRLKFGGGLFGSLLRFLPPELRRAGRDIAARIDCCQPKQQGSSSGRNLRKRTLWWRKWQYEQKHSSEGEKNYSSEQDRRKEGVHSSIAAKTLNGKWGRVAES